MSSCNYTSAMVKALVVIYVYVAVIVTLLTTTLCAPISSYFCIRDPLNPQALISDHKEIFYPPEKIIYLNLTSRKSDRHLKLLQLNHIHFQFSFQLYIHFGHRYNPLSKLIFPFNKFVKKMSFNNNNK